MLRFNVTIDNSTVVSWSFLELFYMGGPVYNLYSLFSLEYGLQVPEDNDIHYNNLDETHVKRRSNGSLYHI